MLRVLQKCFRGSWCANCGIVLKFLIHKLQNFRTACMKKCMLILVHQRAPKTVVSAERQCTSPTAAVKIKAGSLKLYLFVSFSALRSNRWILKRRQRKRAKMTPCSTYSEVSLKWIPTKNSQKFTAACVNATPLTAFWW